MYKRTKPPPVTIKPCCFSRFLGLSFVVLGSVVGPPNLQYRGAWDVPAPLGALSADLGYSFFWGKVPGTSLTLACKVRALLPAILTQRCVSVGTGTEGNTASSSSEDVSASFGRGTFQLMHPPSCNCERSQPPAGGSGFLLTSWRAFPAGICLLGYCMYYFPKCLY